MRDKLILSMLSCMIVFSLLSIASTKADANVTVDINTDGDVNFNSNLNTTGSVDITIDGTNINKQFNAMSTEIDYKLTFSDLSYMFEQVAKYFYGGSDVHPTAISMFDSLNSVFVNRADEQVINAKLDNLNMRVIVLEKALEQTNSTAYCNAKIDVMKEYNLSWVKCGTNSTYYHNVDPKDWKGNDIIAIETVEPEKSTADMKITNFEIPELNAGKFSLIKMTVKNIGNTAGSATVSLEAPIGWFVILRDPTFSLNSNEEKVIEISVFVPENAKGEYTIKGIVSFIHLGETTQISEERTVSVKPRILTMGEKITGYFSSFNMANWMKIKQ